MRTLAAATAIVLAAAVAGGCSPGSGDVGGAAQLAVYVSMPLRGPSGADGRDVADAARMALDDVGGEVAGARVEATFLDDTTGSGDRARWSPVQAAANARTATQDSTTIAFLGDLESGATRASLPVTNAANVLQVSPASGAGDLVAPTPSSDDVPATQPNGRRTFGRVIPSDRAQAAAGATWAERLGARRVATLSDGSAFGDAMVEAFEQSLRGAVVTNRQIDLLYYGGGPDRQPASLSQTAPGLMVTDAELAPGVSEPTGTYATSAALDPSQLPPAGQRFATAFEDRYGRKPGRYAAYGYAGMTVILDSIDQASDPTDRISVLDAFFGIEEPDSVLGSYVINSLGETTLDRMTGYRFEPGGRLDPVAGISAAR